MELTIIDREHYLELVHLQLALGLCTTDFQQQLEHYAYAETKALEMSGKLVSCKSALYFLQWSLDKSYKLQPQVTALRHGLKRYAKKIPKRVLSRSLRIEIAYRQHYACQICQLFPIPPTFEVDHIIELQDGGQDIAENLQAVCVSCHRHKSRLNRLRKNPIFQSSPHVSAEPVVSAEPAVFSKYFHQAAQSLSEKS